MIPFKLSTPVAFIIFNRPQNTKKVFAEIAKAQPPKLLVIGDGPRQNKNGEVELVNATREIIKRVNWPCEIITNFSEINLGCKKRVSSGIDWVFEQVEEAIILEDDCLPDPSFFRFCEEMLHRHRLDKHVGMISGGNFQLGQPRKRESYYFSKYVHIWGWASWRDRWQGSYDVDMHLWPTIRDAGIFEDLVQSKSEASFWSKIFERVYRGQIDTWDYQWVFANWCNGRINVIPSVNLISNIGFAADATHTKSSGILGNIPTNPMEFPLRHPIVKVRNLEADTFTDELCFRTSFIKKIYRFILSRLGI